MWRSQLDRMQFARRQNRQFATMVNAAGGEVLLDHRVRPFGSHHQKFVVLRHADRPQDDVAFLGGIDVAHSRRDDADHLGDPQQMRYPGWYGGEHAWHDVQVEVRGPAVRDVEEVFRERWGDPAALSRRPWHLVHQLLHSPERHPTALPEPADDPPSARAPARSSSCGPTRTAGSGTPSRPAASAASPAATPRPCDAHDG